MCQEKIEKMDNVKNHKLTAIGSYSNKEAGQSVVFRSIIEEGKQLMKAQNVSGILRERTDQGKKVQQFLGVVRSTLKKCEYLYRFPNFEQEERNVSLSCEIRRNGDTIGYVEDMDYLLDCEYIYKQIFKSPIELSDTDTFFFPMDALIYYSEMFNLGVLKPYRENSQEPFCWINDSNKWYIRVSNALISIDIFKLLVQ